MSDSNPMYGVRECRDHWHIICYGTDEDLDLALQGDLRGDQFTETRAREVAAILNSEPTRITEFEFPRRRGVTDSGQGPERLAALQEALRFTKAKLEILLSSHLCIEHGGGDCGDVDGAREALRRASAALSLPDSGDAPRPMRDGPIHTYWHRRREVDPLHGKLTGCLCEACQNERGYQPIGASAPDGLRAAARSDNPQAYFPNAFRKDAARCEAIGTDYERGRARGLSEAAARIEAYPGQFIPWAALGSAPPQEPTMSATVHTHVDYWLDELLRHARQPGDQSDEIGRDRSAIHSAIRTYGMGDDRPNLDEYHAARVAELEAEVAQGCDRCDGCGWWEGGATLKTKCEKCGGTGVVGSAPRGTPEDR